MRSRAQCRITRKGTVMKQHKKHKAPGYADLLLDTLKVIASRGGSASIEEIHDGVIARRNFPDDVVDELHTGSTVTTELEYNLAWARTYLRKNGLILRSKNGVWALTKLGVEASKKESIDKKAIVRGAVAAQKNESAENPLEIEERRPWRDSLSEILHNMNPFAFEVLAQRLLRECGFQDVHVTKKSGDGGIDGTGKLRLNGIFSFNVAFQCKRYKGQVGAGEIRDFRGSLDNNIEKGVLITTGSFSKAAREEAATTSWISWQSIVLASLHARSTTSTRSISRQLPRKVRRNNLQKDY